MSFNVTYFQNELNSTSEQACAVNVNGLINGHLADLTDRENIFTSSTHRYLLHAFVLLFVHE